MEHQLRRHTGNRRIHLILLGIIWLTIHILLFAHYGTRNLFDSQAYIRAADFLISQGGLQEADCIFYAVPITLIAAFRWLFPGEILPFLIFQSMISGLATVSLYFSGSKIFNNHKAGLLAGSIFLLWWDNLQWNTTAMTESLQCSVICFVLYRLTYFAGTKKDFIVIIAWSLVSFLTRPTGIVIVLGVIVFFLYYYKHALREKPLWRITLVIASVAIAYWGANVMFSRWDFTDQYRRGNIITYMDTIEGSPLYDESLVVAPAKPVTDISAMPVMKVVNFIFNDPLYFLKISALKVLYLLAFVRPYYSTLHNLFNLWWISVVYVGFYVGMRKGGNSPVRLFVLVVIAVNCALIGISTVDWDNRFYIPMEPGLVVFAGGGAAYFSNRLKPNLRTT
ncbi:MAG: hypothetical protein ACOYXT_18720 [Bacteroidota bacterium]